MDKLRQLLSDYINNKETILCAIASNPCNREKIQKLRIRPVLKEEELLYQAERFIGTKTYHQNLIPNMLPDLLITALTEDFKQLEVETEHHKLTVLVSKKGKTNHKRTTKNTAGTDTVPSSRFFTQQTKTIYSSARRTYTISGCIGCTNNTRYYCQSKIR